MIRAHLLRQAHLLLLVGLLSALGACAHAPEMTLQPVDSTIAQATWERFTSTASRAATQEGPFQADATLYYSGKEDSQRVSAAIWGNNAATLPLRLDITMGPGSVIARAREDARGIFIHVPRDNAVYYGDGTALLSFGIPVPFTLVDLAALIGGRFGELFVPQDGTMPRPVGTLSGATVYTLTDTRLPGLLSLNPDGLPVAWRENAHGGWEMTIDYWPDSTRNTPRKLYVRHPDGGEATLIVRSLTIPEAPFTPEQLDLGVPPHVRLAPLGNAR